MAIVSGFTFIHNAIEGGYPIVEAIQSVRPFVDEIVVVDMQSTDTTRQVLERLGVRVIDGRWGNQAGETLRQAHGQYVKCQGDVIIHFEGDEVFDNGLIARCREMIDEGITDISVYRLQIEQNFQRCRWYPEPVHRIFPRFSHTLKEGHTTSRHTVSTVIGPEYGYLWDVTNCFRDNFLKRIANQAELWHGEPRYVMTPLHCLHEAEVDAVKARRLLLERHWTWTETPFNIPPILRPLVGKTCYDPIT